MKRSVAKLLRFGDEHREFFLFRNGQTLSMLFIDECDSPGILFFSPFRRAAIALLGNFGLRCHALKQRPDLIVNILRNNGIFFLRPLTTNDQHPFSSAFDSLKLTV